jgi:hypothetical protein
LKDSVGITLPKIIVWQYYKMGAVKSAWQNV